mmetsp:Transcript_48778/g.74233  ORF Transcript_48778/g.74233 Transcript_48778/m.74233 type:complete len:181 (-) Transcript_48778:57-599(-)
MAPLVDTSSTHQQLQYRERSLSPMKEEPPPRRARKRVAFSDFSEMYFVPTAAEMSDEEWEASYMTDSDHRRIRKDINETMDLMKEGEYPGTSERYFRGLEILLPHTKIQRKQRIAFMVGAVLRQQEDSGNLHPEWVQKYLLPLTEPFAQAAHVMGVYDFQMVFADFHAEMAHSLKTRSHS